MNKFRDGELRSFKTYSSDELLRLLTKAVQESSNGSPLPLVRIYLESFSFVGIPLRIEDRLKEPWLTLFQHSEGTRNTDSVVYLPLNQIKCVAVDDARAFLPLLQDQTPQETNQHGSTGYKRPTGVEVPSRISVERSAARATEAGRTLGWEGEITLDWAGRQEDPEARYRLAITLEWLRNNFQKLPRATLKSFRLSIDDSSKISTKDQGRTFVVGLHSDPIEFERFIADLSKDSAKQGDQ